MLAFLSSDNPMGFFQHTQIMMLKVNAQRSGINTGPCGTKFPCAYIGRKGGGRTYVQNCSHRGRGVQKSLCEITSFLDSP